MGDTPLRPQPQDARKVGENVGMSDAHSGTLVMVSEDNPLVKNHHMIRLHTTLNIGFIAACGSIKSVGG